MDDKITLMKDLFEKIYEVHQSTPSSFIQSLDAQRIADDIIHKLYLLQKVIDNHSPRSSRSTRSSSSSSLYDRQFGLQDNNRCSRSSITPCLGGVILEDMDDDELEEAAREAYNRNHSARCIRIVENIFKKHGVISRELFLLGHNAYKSIVDDSIGKKELRKFLDYWKAYLDNVIIKNCNFDDQLEITDCRSECIWKSLMLNPSEPQRLTALNKIMELQMNGYESTTIDFRPFHPKCLRRLRKMCSVIENFFDEFPGFESLPACIEEALEIIRLGVHTAKFDSKEYARETGISSENASDDVCYMESMDLIKEIDIILYKYLECYLANSDSESDCFVSSEDGSAASSFDAIPQENCTLTELNDDDPTEEDKAAVENSIAADNDSAVDNLENNTAFITHL
uniref:Uncharacterized protein n=1 Tax=Syphacia muris TaxID=451379 RepID=A0A0N5AJS8_9BILA